MKQYAKEYFTDDRSFLDFKVLLFKKSLEIKRIYFNISTCLYTNQIVSGPLGCNRISMNRLVLMILNFY